MTRRTKSQNRKWRQSGVFYLLITIKNIPVFFFPFIIKNTFVNFKNHHSFKKQCFTFHILHVQKFFRTFQSKSHILLYSYKKKKEKHLSSFFRSQKFQNNSYVSVIINFLYSKKKKKLFNKRLSHIFSTLSLANPYFYRSSRQLEKSKGKGEIAPYKQFLLYPMFYIFLKNFSPFHQI